MGDAAPYLLVYDAESPSGRRVADWALSRDRHGLVIAFPCQNGELVAIAPELAGRPLLRNLHGMDVGSRAIHQGAALLPHLLDRLPGWRWVAPLARCSWFASRLLASLSR